MSEQESESEVYRVDKGNQSYAAQLARKMASEGDVTIRRPPEKVTEASGQGEEPLSAVSFPHEHRYSSEAESESQGAGQSSFPAFSESTHPSSEESEEPAMTREELKAHLEANEARIEQMTDRVEQKLDNFSSQVDTKISAVNDKIGATRNWVIGIGTAILIVMVSLFVYALNQTDRLEDRVFENTQRIEQVAPQTEGNTSQSDKDSGQEQ